MSVAGYHVEFPARVETRHAAIHLRPPGDFLALSPGAGTPTILCCIMLNQTASCIAQALEAAGFCATEWCKGG